MTFNSFAFLCFFPAFLLLYWAVRGQARVVLTLAASYVFYGFWDPRFLALILLSTSVDFLAGIAIEKAQERGVKRFWLACSLVTNLGLLATFKYFNFFADSFRVLSEQVGVAADWSTLNVILPVGISFYTFQTLSYTIDVHRGQIGAERNFIRFATFVAFFPQLVAGPIVRAKTLVPQLYGTQAFSGDDLLEGLGRMLLGFFKKVVVADSIALVVDPMFDFPTGYGTLNVAILVGLFPIQVYADFSGYSDIAIGAARTMGIRLPENFALPFLSRSFREFWRRWHITLSTWLRDYVFIPLGGSRGSTLMTCRSLAITMLLGGLWHGARWTFVAWGAMHALLLIVEHGFHLPVRKSAKSSDGRSGQEFWLATVAAVAGPVYVTSMFAFTMILFRSPDFSTFLDVCHRLGSMEGLSASDLHNRIPLLKAVGISGVFLMGEAVSHGVRSRLDMQPRSWAPLVGWARPIALAILLWAIALLGTFEGTAFVYFQF